MATMTSSQALPGDRLVIKGTSTGPDNYRALMFPKLSYSRSLQTWLTDKKGRRYKPDLRNLYKTGLQHPVMTQHTRTSQPQFQARFDILDDRFSRDESDRAHRDPPQSPETGPAPWRLAVGESGSRPLPSLDDIKLRNYNWRSRDEAEKESKGLPAEDPMYKYTYGASGSNLNHRGQRSLSPRMSRSRSPTVMDSPRRLQRSTTSLEVVKSLIAEQRKQRQPHPSRMKLTPDADQRKSLDGKKGCLYAQLQRSMISLKTGTPEQSQRSSTVDRQRSLTREFGSYRPMGSLLLDAPKLESPILKRREYKSLEPYRRIRKEKDVAAPERGHTLCAVPEREDMHVVAGSSRPPPPSPRTSREVMTADAGAEMTQDIPAWGRSHTFVV